ncbi:hypothetical protein [Salinisphaera sp. G21_0]|uniref:hypothetical protein n=1 Tax=Salinisphaera sp. G21_0 TaxID=2821094 RepID=UPI001ADD2765|nr:hypothetical protein [Salinisphaera sp. G21_0]
MDGNTGSWQHSQVSQIPGTAGIENQGFTIKVIRHQGPRRRLPGTECFWLPCNEGTSVMKSPGM